MATIALDGSLYDPAVSLAVSAAINASDVLSILHHGDYPRGADHDEAVGVLRNAGFGQASRTLARVLAVKRKAQYDGTRCSAAEGVDTVKRASRVITVAEELLRN